VRLDVRTKRDAMPVGMGLRAVDVGIDPVDVDQDGGRVDGR